MQALLKLNDFHLFRQSIHEGVSGKRGQVPFENLGNHVMGIKQNFGT